MTTFADDLCNKIKKHNAFWADLETVSALAMRRLIPNILIEQQVGMDDANVIERLLRSAVVFAQAENDSDKTLAQDVSAYVALASDDIKTKSLACDLLTDIGNHPGAARMRAQLDIPTDSLASSIRQTLLRALNTVSIGGVDRALTDFQRRVWSKLSIEKRIAISAPTSAGKSFVVVEYLCQQAISIPSFNTVYIAPTRALLTEIHGKLSQRLSEHLTTVRVSTIPTIDSEQKPKQIFVLTQERLQVLLAVWSGSFDLVVVDEAQSIGDDSRGMILQDCLETIKQRSELTRFLFLAPGASNFDSYKSAIDVESIQVERTYLSPVVQNRIVVERSVLDESRIDLTLLTEQRRLSIGHLIANRGFGDPRTMLAAVALELGKSGGSLVYGTGAANAEKVARQIASGITAQEDGKLKELSEFIKQHIHPKYSLVDHVLKGVGFHYGKMPSLLREALEEAFKQGQLDYLVCTTTLFQGVNLPARNVFIDTPTRGKGDLLDAAALWNFAGRAGRLGKEVVGNVFLVGYDTWESQLLTERSDFAITPSFRRVVTSKRVQILAQLRGESVEADDLTIGITETAAGLLISRAARQTLPEFVRRTLADAVPESEQAELVDAAELAYKSLQLPPEILVTNWTVNPYGQGRLLKLFRDRIKERKTEDLIPIHPSEPDTYQRYVKIFSRLNREIFGKSSPQKFNNRLAVGALSWMRGVALPVMISNRVRFMEKSRSAVNIDSVVRGEFEFIEDVLRFRYVQLGRCYVDLLQYALIEAEQKDSAQTVYNFPLALELGVSTIAGQAFIELGLSRITAATLEAMIPDSNPSVERARVWLLGITETGSKLSKVVWSELVRKQLVKSEPDSVAN